MDEEIKALAEATYREKIRRARQWPPSLKIGRGAELFADSCQRIRCGIRAQCSNIGPEEVERVLLDGLARLKRSHDHGIIQYTKDTSP